MKLKPLNFLVQCVTDAIWYLLPQMLLLIFAAVLLVLYGDHSIFLWLNGQHITLFNHPMLWLSELSGGWIILSIFVLIFARKYPKETLLSLIIVFIAWYICITIKYNFFSHWRSPSVEFKPGQVHTLGIALQPELNFPSAHAAIISALFIMIVHFKIPNTGAMLLLSLLALLLVYSRIYVGWSYLSDILAGNLLGILTTLLCLYPMENRINNWYIKKSDWGQTIIIAILRTAAICTILTNLKYLIL